MGKVITWCTIGFHPFTETFDFPPIITAVQEYLIEKESARNESDRQDLVFKRQSPTEPSDLLFISVFEPCSHINWKQYKKIVHFSGEPDCLWALQAPKPAPPNYLAFTASQVTVNRLKNSDEKAPVYHLPFAAISDPKRVSNFMKVASLRDRRQVWERTVHARPYFATCVVGKAWYQHGRPALLSKMALSAEDLPPIHAAGRFCPGGMVRVPAVPGAHFDDSLIEHYAKYKFALVFENCQEDGYITEKITRAFEAGSIPVYFGASDVTEFFNPKAFLLVRGPDDVEGVVQRMKYLLEHPDELDQMASEPIFHPDHQESGKVSVPECFTPGYLHQIFDQHQVDSVLSPAQPPGK
jgi:hypothetical protein